MQKHFWQCRIKIEQNKWGPWGGGEGETPVFFPPFFLNPDFISFCARCLLVGHLERILGSDTQNALLEYQFILFKVSSWICGFEFPNCRLETNVSTIVELQIVAPFVEKFRFHSLSEITQEISQMRIEKW